MVSKSFFDKGQFGGFCPFLWRIDVKRRPRKIGSAQIPSERSPWVFG